MLIRTLLVIGTISLLLSCNKAPTHTDETSSMESQQVTEDSLATEATVEPDTVEVRIDPSIDTSALAKQLVEVGLTNITDLNEQIEVRMMYSTPDNFLEEDVYGDYHSCFLQPEVAEKLHQAEQLLEKQHPNLRLIVFDCVRPRSVQFQMWEIVKGTDQQKYVAPPTGGGSMHNYGAAVDLGLVHVDSGLVDMGTPFDFFGELAQPRYETRFLNSGELSTAQVENRRILRAAMLGAGFHGILSEWWHFNGFKRSEVRARYTLVE